MKTLKRIAAVAALIIIALLIGYCIYTGGQVSALEYYYHRHYLACLPRVRGGVLAVLFALCGDVSRFWFIRRVLLL